jgi:hypothetical protein
VGGIKLVEGRQQDISQNRDKQAQVIHLIQVAAIYLFIQRQSRVNKASLSSHITVERSTVSIGTVLGCAVIGYRKFGPGLCRKWRVVVRKGEVKYSVQLASEWILKWGRHLEYNFSVRSWRTQRKRYSHQNPHRLQCIGVPLGLAGLGLAGLGLEAGP